MEYCPVHTRPQESYLQQQQIPQQPTPYHMILISKYKNKKKAYKESLNELRIQMKGMHEKYLHQEQLLNHTNTQYLLEKQQWSQEKKILNSMLPNQEITLQNLEKKKKSYKQKKLELKNQVKQLKQQCEFQEGQLQQILLENSKIKAILNGKDQECLALQEEVCYYQKRLIQLQRQ